MEYIVKTGMKDFAHAMSTSEQGSVEFDPIP
jgi:hypothetical protein